MWLRKKTQNPPTSCTCWLNPHGHLGRLHLYGIYKRPLRAPTKEDALVLIAVNIGGKNTQEQDQIRIWAAPTAGPEISTVLEGILRRWGGLWLPAQKRTLTAVTQHLLFLLFFTCSVDSFEFFSFFPLCCSCRFYWHYQIQLSFWAFIFFFPPQSHFLLLS